MKAIIVGAIVLKLALIVAVVWTACHFIAKFW